MPILSIQDLKEQFSAGRYPKDKDYEDLIDTLSEPGDPASGLALASVSETEPSNPEIGQLWYNTAEAALYIFIDDFWVEVGS
jgi:hypothetical protein